MKSTDEIESSSVSKVKLVIGLAVSIAVCFSAALIGSIATNSNINEWYGGINKPSWNPPNSIFGTVWTTLFLMMAVAAWLVWKQSGFAKAKFAIGAYAFQLILNVLWSVVFFGLQQIGWACVEITLLWGSIAVTIFLFHRHSTLATILMLPYLAWVSFAAFINFTIWQLN